MITIGILNLQGAVSEHFDITKKAIENIDMENDINVEAVRYADEVAKCSGIIISGGESTVIGKLMHERKIDEVIKENKIPIFGTCAGMVILSKKTDQKQPLLRLIDVEVKRNAFGRQKDSFEKEINILGDNYPGVFIRAPAITNISALDNNNEDNNNNNNNNNNKNIEVLAELDSKIIAIKQENNIAMSFHPELTDDTRLHEYYIKCVLNSK